MNKIPADMATITPGLVVNNAKKAIELYQKAFGATVDYCMDAQNGKVMHAQLQIGGSKIFLSDVDPGMGCGTPTVSTFYVYIDDVDAGFTKATQAGLKELYAPQDMFWGDRTGTLDDGFGNRWTLATHVRDVSPEEMEAEKQKWLSKAAA